MTKAQPDKRSRLIQTAVKLAYELGFRETSLADIAEAAAVPLGNIYYYFKTKEELGEAIVERRLEEFRALRKRLEQAGSPKERLLAFVDNIHSNRQQLARGDVRWAGYALNCTRRAELSRRSRPRSSPSRWLGSRTSSAPLAKLRMRGN